jgi:hypothetical protein
MGASLFAPYIGTFLVFSLGITILAIRLGRQLTPGQNQPSAVRSRVVAQGGATAEPAVAQS